MPGPETLNVLPPQEPNPIELELIALREVAVHPEALKLQFIMLLGGLALSSVESALVEPSDN